MFDWSVLKNITKEFLALGDQIEKLFDSLKILKSKPDEIELLTYDETIKYFINEKPENPDVIKGVILRQPYEERWLVVQAFLNESDEIICDDKNKPLNKFIIVTEFDKELKDVFKDKNLIIVE